MTLSAPISWPLGKALDAMFGTERAHGTRFDRRQIRTMINLHSSRAGGPLGVGLSADEVNIVSETLKLAHKTVIDCMTPLSRVSMLPEEAVLDEDTVATVLGCGHSRIPVYRGGNVHNIVGVLMVKKLIVVNPEGAR